MTVAESNISLDPKADADPSRLRDIEERNRREGKKSRYFGPLLFFLYSHSSVFTQ